MHDVTVLRALMHARTRVQEGADRALRRAQNPKNAGARWTEEDKQTVVAAFNAGDPVKAIAEEMGRTERSIEAQLEALGLIAAKDRTTADRFRGG